VRSSTETSPAQLKALWNKGVVALHNGDYKAARRAWQQISLANPNNAAIKEALVKLDVAEKNKTRSLAP
jgi:Tfp pilus assembly protein PilF